MGALQEVENGKLGRRMKLPQEFFVITIKELPDKNFGIGGKTIDKVKDEYMKKQGIR